jgi:CRP/FNR family transcriptional regulator, anaerobic regulatory protein
MVDPGVYNRRITCGFRKNDEIRSFMFLTAQSLYDFIASYSPLGFTEWQQIIELFERKEFSKNEIILEEGKICRHFYLLESGLIRFYYTIDGNDITKTFTIAPYCFTSRTSFRKHTPSLEGIQALEKTVTWQITYDRYSLLEHFASWNMFMKRILNEIQEFADQLYMQSKTMTAEARYKELLLHYPPGLIQKIPLKHLSTFLGIAPQSLSRIRQKIHSDSLRS